MAEKKIIKIGNKTINEKANKTRVELSRYTMSLLYDRDPHDIYVNIFLFYWKKLSGVTKGNEII